MSTWVKFNGVSSWHSLMGVHDAANHRMFVDQNAGGTEFGVGLGNTYRTITVSTLAPGQWYYVSVTGDGTTGTLYLNGTQTGSSFSYSQSGNNSNIFLMGARTYNGAWQGYLDGIEDEVRLSNSARSAAWIKFEYNNMADTANNISFGSPLIQAGSSFSSLSLTGTYTLSGDISVSSILNLGPDSSLDLNGYTITATNATITNLGTITLNGGTISHNAESLSFTDSSYASSSSATAPGRLYVSLTEGDENLLSDTVETVTVTFTTTAGDSETATLTESSASSGIFRGSIATGETNESYHTGNGIVEVVNDTSTTVTVTYTDSGDSLSSTATTTLTGTPADTTVAQSGGGGGAGGSRRSGVIRSQSLPMLSERRFTTGEIVSAKQQGEEGQSDQQQPSLAPWPDFSPSHPFAEAALTLYNAGIVKGNDDGTVRLDRSISRIEALTLLTRTLGAEPRPGTQLSFTDIDPSSWYAEPLRIAIAKKIVKGFPDGTFRPAEPLNLVQSLKLICISLGLASQEDEQRAFQWYDPYVTVGREHGLIRGAIDPAKSVTRGEFFEWLVKVLEK